MKDGQDFLSFPFHTRALTKIAEFGDQIKISTNHVISPVSMWPAKVINVLTKGTLAKQVTNIQFITLDTVVVQMILLSIRLDIYLL